MENGFQCTGAQERWKKGLEVEELITLKPSSLVLSRRDELKIRNVKMYKEGIGLLSQLTLRFPLAWPLKQIVDK